jgi:long-chain acyl-CoA synthetase
MSELQDLLTQADAVAHHAARRPDASAFVCGDDRLSFAELERRANAVARGLHAMNVRPGERVAYLGKNANTVMEVAIGAIRMGAVFTPINWRLAPPEIAFMLMDSAAPLVVVDAEYAAVTRSLASGLPSLRHVICIGEAGDPAHPGYEAWRERHSGGLESGTAHAAGPHDIALQIYTSGTTGRPKGVMLTHRNLRSLAGLEAPPEFPAWNRWSEHDVSLVTPPLFHVGGFGWVTRGLFRGSTHVILREFSTAAVLEAIGRHRVTRMALVPSAIHMVLQEPAAAATDFGSLHYIYYGTSPIATDLLRTAMRVFGCRFVQSYGQTESASSIVALAPEDHTLDNVPHMRSAGKALPGVEIEIRDGGGNTLPIGKTGEIVTRSASNMAGYSNMPKETAETLGADGWLRTGDAGRLDENGYLYVHDRIKEMIITGGENVYPAEVENALYGHPAVSEVAVVGLPSEKWGQAVTAVVLLKPGQAATEAELIAWARQRIGGYKLPKKVIFTDELPRNSTGKVVKAELRRRLAPPPATEFSGATS